MSFPFERANEHDFCLRGVHIQEVDASQQVAAWKTVHSPSGLLLAARAMWQRGLRSIRRLFGQREPVWQPIDAFPVAFTCALIAVFDRNTGLVLLRPELYMFTGQGIGAGWIGCKTTQPLALTAAEVAVWRPTKLLLPTLDQCPAELS